MHRRIAAILTAFLLACSLPVLVFVSGCKAAQRSTAEVKRVDPLSAWNDTPTRRAIVEFVDRVTTPGSREFVAPAERIAVFDNDGTLWCEQPEYVQVQFMMDRVRALMPMNPGWATTEPFMSLARGDYVSAFSGPRENWNAAYTATHAGMSTDEFNSLVNDWLATSTNSKWNRPHSALVYKPMLELMGLLRSRGFKVYIVSGGDTEFMRVFAEVVYGVPPEQVIGTSLRMEYQVGDSGPTIHRRQELEYGNDRGEKVVSIQRHIGRRPIIAVGNSDGDYAMIEWTTAGDGARLGAFVHHTDAEREWAYDRGSRIGKLEKGLDSAAARGWVLIDMKQDWRVIFP
jgi:phosphoserine phosphatase